MSQLYEWYNAEGKKLALVHRFYNPDGSLGGTSRDLDPHALMINDTLHFDP